MKRMLGYLIIVGMCVSARADFIVLKNGKKFEIDGSYEVKGQLVVFRSMTGDLTQVPLKIVDVERSETFTEQMIEHRRKKAEEAELARIEAEKRSLKIGSDISEIAEYIEKTRGEDNPRPVESVQIGNDNLEQYAEDNPRVINTQAAGSGTAPTTGSVEDFNRAREELGTKYQQLEKELADLEEQLNQEQLRRANLESISALDDDFYGPESEANPRTAAVESETGASPAFLEMERAEKRIEELRDKIKKKKDEISRTERTARSQGVKDYKRYKKRDGGDGTDN